MLQAVLVGGRRSISNTSVAPSKSMDAGWGRGYLLSGSLVSLENFNINCSFILYSFDQQSSTPNASFLYEPQFSPLPDPMLLPFSDRLEF